MTVRLQEEQKEIAARIAFVPSRSDPSTAHRAVDVP